MSANLSRKIADDNADMQGGPYSRRLVGLDLGEHPAGASLTGNEKIAQCALVDLVAGSLDRDARTLAHQLAKGRTCPHLNDRQKSSAMSTRLHARIANIRADVVHRLTTRLCREHPAVAIEDLQVKGMLVNDRLARAIRDVGLGWLRLQSEYKAICTGWQPQLSYPGQVRPVTAALPGRSLP